MRFNNIVALLAASQTVAAQAVRSRPNGGSNTMVVAPLEPVGEEPPPSTTTTPQAVIALAPIPMSSTAQRQGGQSTPNGRSATRMGSMVATRRPTARLTTTTTSTRGQVGIETVSIVSSGTRSQGKKRQNAPAPVVATVAICPIYAARVPGAPCYPCAVGQPNAQQTLGVVTVSPASSTREASVEYTHSCKFRLRSWAVLLIRPRFSSTACAVAAGLHWSPPPSQATLQGLVTLQAVYSVLQIPHPRLLAQAGQRPLRPDRPERPPERQPGAQVRRRLRPLPLSLDIPPQHSSPQLSSISLKSSPSVRQMVRLSRSSSNQPRAQATRHASPFPRLFATHLSPPSPTVR